MASGPASRNAFALTIPPTVLGLADIVDDHIRPQLAVRDLDAVHSIRAPVSLARSPRDGARDRHDRQSSPLTSGDAVAQSIRREFSIHTGVGFVMSAPCLR